MNFRFDEYDYYRRGVSEGGLLFFYPAASRNALEGMIKYHGAAGYRLT